MGQHVQRIVNQQQNHYALLKGKLAGSHIGKNILAGMVQQKYALFYKQLLARLLPTVKRPGESLGVHDISFHRNEKGMLMITILPIYTCFLILLLN